MGTPETDSSPQQVWAGPPARQSFFRFHSPGEEWNACFSYSGSNEDRMLYTVISSDMYWSQQAKLMLNNSLVFLLRRDPTFFFLLDVMHSS